MLSEHPCIFEEGLMIEDIHSSEELFNAIKALFSFDKNFTLVQKQPVQT